MFLYRKRIARGVTAGVTTVAMLLQPQLLVAGESMTALPVPAKTMPLKTMPAKGTSTRTEQTPRDVVLQDKGVLVGRIVDAQGLAVANSPVSFQTGGKEVVRVVSDEMGRFQVTGLQGGVYQVASTGHQGVYRLWAPRTAPPAAAKGLSLVSQPVDVVRGQYGGRGGGNPFSTVGQWIAEHPIITAGAVAAAIAIPIALDDDDDPPPATP